MTERADSIPPTLKDQIDANCAALEARFAARHHGSEGRDWFQLSEAEEDIFRIDRDRFPRMVTTHEAYEAFKHLTDAPHRDEQLIERERQKRPEWCGKGTDQPEFYAFAKALGGLSNREADAIWCKQHFWTVRLGVVIFADERPSRSSP